MTIQIPGWNSVPTQQIHNQPNIRPDQTQTSTIVEQYSKSQFNQTNI